MIDIRERKKNNNKAAEGFFFFRGRGLGRTKNRFRLTYICFPIFGTQYNFENPMKCTTSPYAVLVFIADVCLAGVLFVCVRLGVCSDACM